MVKTDLFNGFSLCSTCPANYMVCDSINHAKTLMYFVLYYVIIYSVFCSILCNYFECFEKLNFDIVMTADIFTSLNSALFSKNDWFVPQYKSTCDQIVFRLTMR